MAMNTTISMPAGIKNLALKLEFYSNMVQRKAKADLSLTEMFERFRHWALPKPIPVPVPVPEKDYD